MSLSNEKKDESDIGKDKNLNQAKNKYLLQL